MNPLDLPAPPIPPEADNPDNQSQWPYEALKQFRLIFKAVQQHSQWVESQCGLTSAQLWTMWEIAKKPGLNVSELAKAMSIHHSTASNLLEKLAKKKLITRERISADQRVVTVTLTVQGNELIAKAPFPAQGILQHALFELPEDVIQPLAQHLDSLAQKMEIKDTEPAMQPINPFPKKTRNIKAKGD